LHYETLIEIQKEPKEPPKKKGWISSWFSRTKENPDEHKRFLAFYESRILILKPIKEEERSYGSHFSQPNEEESQQVDMPRIWWDAQICSSRSILNLSCIRLLNYKAVYGETEEQEV
jgi:hypothetical protein